VTTRLLDVNVLIALAWPNHVHHELAQRWFESSARKAWATCPLTQLAFVRISSNPGIVAAAVSPRVAARLLAGITAQSGHEFWPDALDLAAVAGFSNLALVGHRQVTDAYLLALARSRGGRLATLDRGVADLVEAGERASLVEIIEGAPGVGERRPRAYRVRGRK
jgi:uncharacterized protein